MIHVCYGLQDGDGRYSKFVGTSMLSLFENTAEPVTVHILHDNTLNNQNRDKLNYIAGQYKQHLKFYDVSTLNRDEIERIINAFPYLKGRTSGIGTMFRLWIHKLIPDDISKVIYIDSDTIVNLDIKELWNIDIESQPLAAVPEMANGEPFVQDKILGMDGVIPKERYMNAGVLSINLKYWRQDSKLFNDGCDFISKNPKYSSYLDQDLLNYCFAAKMKVLPVKFNSFITAERLFLRSNAIEKKIYHYTGGSFGFGLKFDTSDIFNRLYFNYFSKTPWFNLDMITNLAQAFSKFYNERQALYLNVIKLLADKKRAFFTEARNANAVKELFNVNDDEELIFTSVGMQELINSMNKFKNEKIYFILVGDYNAVRNVLIQNKFIEGVDFVNGIMLLTEQQGSPLNTYFLVRAM